MSKKNPKIKGIVFKHDGKNDYSIWMPDLTKNEEKRILQALVAVFADNGTSIRGTKEDILQAISEDL
jgi:hypothetical protein